MNLWHWLQCKARGGHRLAHVRNVYGDEILLLDARSIWRCAHCGTYERRHQLHTAPAPRDVTEAWLEGSRFNCLALHEVALPDRAQFPHNAAYLEACRAVVDEHMALVALSRPRRGSAAPGGVPVQIIQRGHGFTDDLSPDGVKEGGSDAENR